MFISKRPNGIYYINYTAPNGKRNCKSTRTGNKREAMKILDEFRIEHLFYIKSKIKKNLVRFRLEYLIYSSKIHSPNHTDTIKTTFNNFIKRIGDIELTLIDKVMIQNYPEERMMKVSPYAIKRDIANLHAAFNLAIDKGYLKDNPVKGIKKPKIPERMPFFSQKSSLQNYYLLLIMKTLKIY